MHRAMQSCILSSVNPIQLRMARSSQQDDRTIALLAAGKWMRAPGDIEPGLLAIGLAERNAV